MTLPHVPTMAIILVRDGRQLAASAALAMLSYRPACDLAECWNAKVGHGPVAGDLVELPEFLPAACEAHL